MKRRLPAPERYPLPAGEITYRALDAVAGRAKWPADRATDAATLAHFGFGAAAGAAYGALRNEPTLASAIRYGLAVWTVSYFGWVPAFGFLTPAHRHPVRRSALMIAAHVVWGATLGWAARHLLRSEDVFLDTRTGAKPHPTSIASPDAVQL